MDVVVGENSLLTRYGLTAEGSDACLQDHCLYSQFLSGYSDYGPLSEVSTEVSDLEGRHPLIPRCGESPD